MPEYEHWHDDTWDIASDVSTRALVAATRDFFHAARTVILSADVQRGTRCMLVSTTMWARSWHW